MEIFQVNEIPNLYTSQVPPNRESLEQLRQFNLVWNLAREYRSLASVELKYCKNVIIGDISDYSVPEKVDEYRKQVEQVSDIIMFGHNVLIHCAAGHGRTGMTLAILLAKIKNISPEEAIVISKKHCRGPEVLIQEEFVKDFFSTTE